MRINEQNQNNNFNDPYLTPPGTPTRLDSEPTSPPPLVRRVRVRPRGVIAPEMRVFAALIARNLTEAETSLPPLFKKRKDPFACFNECEKNPKKHKRDEDEDPQGAALLSHSH